MPRISPFVGRTSRRLLDRTNLYLHYRIRNGQFSRNRSTCSCKSPDHFVSHDSAFGQHLLDNQLCSLQYNNDTGDSPYTLLVALLLIFSPWKLHLLTLFNLIFVDEKNSFTALKPSFVHSILIGRSPVQSN